VLSIKVRPRLSHPSRTAHELDEESKACAVREEDHGHVLILGSCRNESCLAAITLHCVAL